MPDDNTEARGNVECHVLRGSDGSLYILSEEVMNQHRIPPEEADAALEALEAQVEVSGFARGPSSRSLPQPGQFNLVVKAPFQLNNPKPFVPTASTWFDIV